MHPTILRKEYTALLGLTEEIFMSNEEYPDGVKALLKTYDERRKEADMVWSTAWDNALQYGVAGCGAIAEKALSDYWQKAIDELKAKAATNA